MKPICKILLPMSCLLVGGCFGPFGSSYDIREYEQIITSIQDGSIVGIPSESDEDCLLIYYDKELELQSDSVSPLEPNIIYCKYEDQTIEVCFYHRKGMAIEVIYEDLVYTNNQSRIEELNNECEMEDEHLEVRNLAENWYLITIR